MIFEVALLSFALSSAPRKSSSNDESLWVFNSVDSAATNLSWTLDSSIRPEFLFASGLEDALAKDLASIKEVHHIMAERVEDNILVWIAIDSYDNFSIRQEVYQKELSLIDGFPEVNFDFNLFPASPGTDEELSSGAQVIYSRL